VAILLVANAFTVQPGPKAVARRAISTRARGSLIASPAMARRCAGVVVLVVALASCGGSSSGTLTHAQLVSKANAICAQRNAQIAALPRALANPTTAKSTAQVIGDVLAIDRPLIAQLQALKPPAADKATWSQAMATNNNIVQITKQLQAAAQANNETQFRQVGSQLSPLAQKLTGYQKQLGLTECEKQPMPSK
jgi:hypothetical protein